MWSRPHFDAKPRTRVALYHGTLCIDRALVQVRVVFPQAGHFHDGILSAFSVM